MSSDPAASSPRTGAVRLALGAALVLLTFAAFSPAGDAAFLNWDDRATLLETAQWRGLGAEPLAWAFQTAHMGPYQPLAWLSYGLDHALWGLGEGLDQPAARGFHLTNLVLHAVGALLVWRLAFAMLRRVRPGASTLALELAAVFGAAFHALHPLRVESVAWVTERRDVLCALFYAAAAWMYVRGAPSPAAAPAGVRTLAAAPVCAAAAALAFWLAIDWSASGALELVDQGGLWLVVSSVALAASVGWAARCNARDAAQRRWFALSVFMFVLALLSKGLAMVLPAVLLIADVWPLRRVRGLREVWIVAAEKAPWFALAVMAARLAMWGQASLAEALVSWERHTLPERLLQALHGLAFYPAKTLVPLGLSPLYQLPDTLRLDEWRFALPAMGAPLALVAAMLARKRAPWLIAALLSFLVSIAPVLGLTQAGPQLVADRYSILACLPFALLAAGAALEFASRAGAARRVTPWIALAWVAGLAALTHEQTKVWRDDRALWTHALEVRPRDGRVYGQMANVVQADALASADGAERRAGLERAAQLFAREMELDPTPIANDLVNYGTVLLRLERASEAEGWLRRALLVRPGHALTHANLGAALAAQRRNREAADELRRALELDPQYARGWHQLGLTLASLGDRGGAIAALERCVELWPSFEPARRKLAELGAAR